MEDRGKEERIQKKVLVCFNGEGFSVYSNTKDVSDHGAFISTQYLLNENADVNVKIDNASHDRKAKVRWISSNSNGVDIDNIGFGIEFIG